jgi:hypothetical protein
LESAALLMLLLGRLRWRSCFSGWCTGHLRRRCGLIAGFLGFLYICHNKFLLR